MRFQFEIQAGHPLGTGHGRGGGTVWTRPVEELASLIVCFFTCETSVGVATELLTGLVTLASRPTLHVPELEGEGTNRGGCGGSNHSPPLREAHSRPPPRRGRTAVGRGLLGRCRSRGRTDEFLDAPSPRVPTTVRVGRTV